MRKKIINLIIFIVLFCVLYFAISIYRGYRFYNSVFRLSYEEITFSLEKTTPTCKKFKDCKLEPGDILIRRYITTTTNLFNKYFNPYFTHSAFYLGNDELFEAMGATELPKDEIQITNLSESYWLNEDMENFVVIRPKNYNGRLENIILNLRNIADDPQYRFGPLEEGGKNASCSDAILKYLADEKILTDLSRKPEIITPDYLFWVTERSDLDFEVIGYNINQKNEMLNK